MFLLIKFVIITVEFGKVKGKEKRMVAKGKEKSVFSVRSAGMKAPNGWANVRDAETGTLLWKKL